MARIKGGLNAKKRHNRTLKLAKGYRGARSKQYRVAKQSVMRALTSSYAGRKERKRQFRRLWIARINAAARMNGLSYSKLMHGLKVAGVDMNRKMLAEMAVNDAAGFAAVAEVAPLVAPFAKPPEIALAPNDDNPISNPNTVPLPAMLQILFKSFVIIASFNSIPLFIPAVNI